MNQAKKNSNKLFNIDENAEVFDKKSIPPLKICLSPKAIDTTRESSSLTYRMKRRNQMHKSLDFNLTASLMLTPKVVKADHSIVPQIMPKASTYRKINFGKTITVNNRMVSKNIFLDSLPV